MLKAILHPSKRLLILGTALAIVIVIIAAAVISYNVYQSNYKALLTGELNHLQLAPQPPISESYYGGLCLDNCPGLSATYTITPIKLSDERTIIVDKLQSSGYKFDHPNTAGDTFVSGERTLHDGQILGIDVYFKDQGADTNQNDPLNASDATQRDTALITSFRVSL